MHPIWLAMLLITTLARPAEVDASDPRAIVRVFVEAVNTGAASDARALLSERAQIVDGRAGVGDARAWLDREAAAGAHLELDSIALADEQNRTQTLYTGRAWWAVTWTGSARLDGQWLAVEGYAVIDEGKISLLMLRPLAQPTDAPSPEAWPLAALPGAVLAASGAYLCAQRARRSSVSRALPRWTLTELHAATLRRRATWPALDRRPR
jgi:hypothetical protein